MILTSEQDHTVIKSHARYVVYILICAIPLSFFGGWYFGSRHGLADDANVRTVVVNKEAPSSIKTKDVDFNLFWDVWTRVRDNYVDQPVDEGTLFYGAISGMVSSLGDPYSVFMEPVAAKKFSQELSGSFDGIGAEIGMKNKQIMVIAPLPESPSEKAGLHPGDFIISIDGVSTVDMTLDNAVNRIRGKKGTQVTLKVVQGSSEPKDFKITRNKIVVPSVTYSVKDDGIAYIKLSHFNDDTIDRWQKIARQVTATHPKGIILDLRNDPGGYLETAITIASYWVGPNQTVAKEKDSAGKVHEFSSRGIPAFKGIKTVVLINEGSASASEIVAGALQDYGLATLVGKKSFGKGSVQDLQSLSGNASLKLTIAKWLTPKDRSINELGIIPDTIVEFPAEDFATDKDPQLDAARALFK